MFVVEQLDVHHKTLKYASESMSKLDHKMDDILTDDSNK